MIKRLWHCDCDDVRLSRRKSSRPRLAQTSPYIVQYTHTPTHQSTPRWKFEVQPAQLQHCFRSRQFTSTYSARPRCRPSIGILTQTRAELPGSVPLVWVYFPTLSRMLRRPGGDNRWLAYRRANCCRRLAKSISEIPGAARRPDGATPASNYYDENDSLSGVSRLHIANRSNTLKLIIIRVAKFVFVDYVPPGDKWRRQIPNVVTRQRSKLRGQHSVIRIFRALEQKNGRLACSRVKTVINRTFGKFKKR